jgi:hypothetical protein
MSDREFQAFNAAWVGASGPIEAPPAWTWKLVTVLRITRPPSWSPCWKYALLDMSERGDIVLGPFIGSGSTLIAAV